MRAPAAAAVLSLLLVGPGAGAATITVSFTGTVSTVPTELTAFFAEGDPVSGSFQIDSETVDSNPSDTGGTYFNPTAFAFDFGGYLAAKPNGAPSDVVLIEDELSQDIDRYVAVAGCGVCTGASLNGYTPALLRFQLDGPGSALPDDSLPTSLSLAAFDVGFARIVFSYLDPNASIDLDAEVDSVSVTVPEPAALALLVLAGAAAGMRRRS